MPEYGWITIGDGRQVYRRIDVHPPTLARSSLPFPMVITDDMPATEHVDGKFYDSKSRYREVTKAKGLVEVGNDPARFRTPKRPDRDKAIDQAIERAISRT
jgi:hypothetical protein